MQSKHIKLLLILLAAISLSAVSLLPTASVDREKVSCETTQSWLTIASEGSSTTDKISAVRDSVGPAIQWELIRRKPGFSALAIPITMTGFKTLDFDIWSKETTMIVIPIEETTKAKFHVPLSVEAGKWKHIQITPGSFRPSDDSPVKKSVVDPAQLAFGLGIVDFGGVIGQTGPNTIRVANVALSRESLTEATVSPIIDGKIVDIPSGTILRKDVIVRNGGALRIRSARFTLAANITLDNGKLEIANSSVTVNNRFPHDRTINGIKKSTISFSNSNFTSATPFSIGLMENSRVEMIQCHFNGAGTTTGVPQGCSLTLNNAKRPGEFIIMPGAHAKVIDSEAVLFWPWFKETNKCMLKLPKGESIDNWSMPQPAGIDLSIKNSRGVMWGLVLDSGADLALDDSNLMVAGISFARPEAQTVSDIKNKSAVSSMSLKLADRKLALKNSTVGIWNFYPRIKSNVTLANCLFGEIMTFDDAIAKVVNSTCDGAGGYIGTRERSSLTLSNCTLNCPVTAVNNSKMILENCHVNGNVSASNDATITLINTSVRGTISKLDRAQIERR